MRKGVLKLAVVGLALATAALAQIAPAPEIDPGSAVVPFALLGGAIMIVRSRIRR